MTDGELQAGVYEDLVTSALESRLAALPGLNRAQIRELDDAEASDRFALHVADAVRRALETRPVADRARDSACVVAALLSQLHEQIQDYPADADLPALLPRVLTGIAERNPDGSFTQLPGPLTPLLDTTVLTNSKQDRNMSAHLGSEIASATGVDAIIAFIRRPGVAPLLGRLQRLTERGHPLRILTTSFTGFTEIEALELLADSGAQIRVSYDTSSSRLHAKAWIFHRPTQSATAYVGSSNFTRHALESGMEWNVRLSQRRNPDAVAKMMRVFDAYWESTDFVDFHADEFRLRTQLPGDPPPGLLLFEIAAHPFQQRMLDQIAAARLAGHHRNLLVSATGTGKTVMAALDYKRLRTELTRARLLFVAHREEILDQSLRTFRTVLGDAAFGEKWVGTYRPAHFEHVFASIQSLHSNGLADLDPSHFDVVIVDEFHHAAARTYETLLGRVAPKELLGLTATPERADGLSILEQFDGRIAAEMRLWDAIAEGRLVPFQYFAIHDGTSLLEVPWKRGRGYDVEALSNVYTSDEAWIRLVIRRTAATVDVRSMRALGFCVSVAHAHFVAARFSAAGIPAVAVSAITPENQRRAALHDLASGRVRAVFSVDLFNEGIDIPAVDTLIMMRPTESATLFLQQLGRGLRRTGTKSECTVLDFVSQHRREFRFDRKLGALIGTGSRPVLERNFEQGFPNLPPGASVTMDAVAAGIILESIRNALPTKWPQRVEELRAMINSGQPATLRGYLSYTGLDLFAVYSAGRCWSDLLAAAGQQVARPGPHEAALRRAIGRLLHADDRERLDGYRTLLAGSRPIVAQQRERARRLWRMLITQVADQALTRDVGLLWRHPQVRSELVELLAILADDVDHLHEPVPTLPDCPLLVHARYTRMEIQAALGDGASARTPTWREGVRWLPGAQVDVLLVTLDKANGNFSPTTAYHDYAVTPTLFHWESQSTTSPESPTGRRYVTHATGGSQVLLFARMSQEDRDFWFLGPATYLKHEGSRPMAVTWHLEHAIPADIYPDFAAVGAA